MVLRIERIGASQGPLLKELRCRALEDAPSAFSGTLEEAKKRREESWAAWAENGANNPRAVTFIAYSDDKPCGMMGCRLGGEKNEVAELLAVWVAPEVRRLKVGQSLLEKIKQWARENQAGVLHIWVAERNAGAMGFYQAAGCEVTDGRQPFPSDASQEEILLSLQL